jgi:hypothetical protein
MMRATLAAAAALSLLAGSALTGAAAQTGDTKPVPLNAGNARALASLLDDGFAVATVTAGRPGEQVLLLKRDAKHFVCVLTDIRGEAYGEAAPKPAARPCLPLN